MMCLIALVNTQTVLKKDQCNGCAQFKSQKNCITNEQIQDICEWIDASGTIAAKCQKKINPESKLRKHYWMCLRKQCMLTLFRLFGLCKDNHNECQAETITNGADVCYTLSADTYSWNQVTSKCEGCLASSTDNGSNGYTLSIISLGLLGFMA